MDNEELLMTEEQETFTVVDDILHNVAVSSSNLETTAQGSKERDVESQIYDRQQKLVLEYERFDLEKQRFSLEQRKAELMAELEAARTHNQCVTNWCNVGINALKAALATFLGFCGLKFNMKYGGLNDGAMRSWISQLLKKD